jgi:DNA-binding NtrC family response regulator
MKVLVIDDEKNIREHLAAYVASLGHIVDTAAHGAAAMEKLNRGHFDIVLSDVAMPGMNGLTLLREIRRQQPDVAVVLMTAYATVPQAIEAMRAGAFEYLMKPFAPEDVRLLINHLLDVRASRPDRPAGRASETAQLPPDTDLRLKTSNGKRTAGVQPVAPTLEDAAKRPGINPVTCGEAEAVGLDNIRVRVAAS